MDSNVNNVNSGTITLNTSIVDLGSFIFVISIIWLATNYYIESNKEKERIQQFELETVKRENEAKNLFAAQLIESQENERNRIALELHDSVGQKLLLIKNQVLSGLKQATKHNEEAILLSVGELADDTISEIRNITYDLRPKYLDQLGINAAIETITEKISETSDIRIILEIDDCIDSCVKKNDQINFFRIIQESLNNIVKHSEADVVFIKIKANNNKVLLEIKDNGHGNNSINYSKGIGITGMKERAKMLNADFSISSNETGTKVKMEYSIKEKDLNE